MSLTDSSLCAAVTELSGLTFQTSLDGFRVTVTMFPVLDTNHVVGMLFGKNLAVQHGLNGGVVVVLVNLTVNGSGDLLMSRRLDGFLHDSGGNLLVDGGIMMTSLVPVLGYGQLSILYGADTH
jgi:hypothetical protein